MCNQLYALWLSNIIGKRSKFMAELIPVEDALKIVLDNVNETPVNEVHMLDALGCPVAEDLFSDTDINAFDDTAMDGFAVRARDIAGASKDNPVELKIMDVIGAGYVYNGTIGKGEAVRIMTGAAMADGTDTVVKIEDVTVTGKGEKGDTVVITKPQEFGVNVRKAGEEAKKGDKVFNQGDVINAAGVGLLSTTGNFKLKIHKQPKVAVISIGSELVDSSEVPPFGMRRDSNRYTLSAMALEAGGDVTLYPIVSDDPEAIEKIYRDAKENSDIVVSSGGACGGDFDYITKVITDLSDVKFEAVNMKPGKAQTFGVCADGTLLFGLSGNPAACATGFEMLVRPAIRKMLGFKDLERPHVEAILGADFKKKGTRRNLLRGKLSLGADGEYVATPLKSQSSGLIGETAKSDCLIVIPEDFTGVMEKGTKVDCIRTDVTEGTVL